MGLRGDCRGQKLTEIINRQHENIKYLPGIKLPSNVVAMSDLEAVVASANMLVFVLPPQFLRRLLPTIRKKVQPGTGPSLSKGSSLMKRRMSCSSQTSFGRDSAEMLM